MTVGQAQKPVDAAGDSAAQAWSAVRHAADIQYQPLPPYRPLQNQPPEWLEALLRTVGEMLQKLGELFGLAWPTFEKVLIALAAILVLFVLWRIFVWWRQRPRMTKAAAEEWRPDAARARALLADADRLAAEGRYDEATHLLLRRSVEDIDLARPGLLHPAITAREISVLPLLPQAGRDAFAIIATRVERSLFALRALGQDDWSAAREAYTRFTRVGLAG